MNVKVEQHLTQTQVFFIEDTEFFESLFWQFSVVKTQLA